MKEIEINLIEIFYIISKKARLLFITFLVVFVITCVIALLIPKTYLARGVILPESSGTGFLGDLMQNNMIAEMLVGSDFGSVQTSQVQEILVSERLIRDLIQEFDLVHLYQFDKHSKYFIEDVIKKFMKEHYLIEENDNNAIEIVVIDKSPERAANMVNYLMDRMNEIFTDLQVQHARNIRQFLDDRLKLEKLQLSEAENSFETFSRNHKVLLPESQVESAINNVAAILKLEYLTGIELNMAKKSFSKGHPAILKLERKLGEIKRQLRKIYKDETNNFTFPLSKASAIMKQYFRLQRDVKVHNEVYLFLLKLYEQAKYNEANEVPKVKVLQRAFVPEKRYKPRRKKLVIMAVAAMEFLLIIMILIQAYFQRYKQAYPGEYQQLTTVLNNFSFGLYSRIKK